MDAGGGILEAWRWKVGEDPARSYQALAKYQPPPLGYIEQIRLFPGLAPAVLINTQALLVNVGQWQAVLDILGIRHAHITPNDWLARYGLSSWRKRKAHREALNKLARAPALSTPLDLARHLWPQAPLKTLADDGVAVALLLADLARRDDAIGLGPWNTPGHDQPPLPMTTKRRRNSRRPRTP